MQHVGPHRGTPPPHHEAEAEGLSRRSFVRRSMAAGGAVLLAPLAGCAGGPTGTPGPGTITLGLNRSLVSLDNKLNQFDAAVTVQRAVRQALTRIGPDLTPQLVLADRFAFTDPTTWTVRLRAGVRYSDGRPVQIRDVATALEMYRRVEGSFLAPQFPEWPRVRALDERTFTLTTERPLPTLDFLMSNILITPAADNEPKELDGGVGSGPYVVSSANRGTGDYTLRANPRYWGPPARTREVRVQFVPEESSRVVSLRSGELDVIDSLGPESAEQLDGLPGVQLDTRSGTRVNQLADARVREALTWAIDGRALAEDVLTGSVTAIPGVVPGTLQGAVTTGTYRYDPRRARQLLEAAGVRDLALTFIWESGEFANDSLLMEATMQMLGDVGIRVRLKEFQPGGDISQWRQGKGGDWDVLGNGYGNQTGLAFTSLQGMYGGTPEKEKTRDTYQGYVFPKIAAELEAIGSEVDDARRDRMLAAVQRDIWATWPCLWAFSPKVVLARRDRVEGLGLTSINSYDLAAVRLKG
jgi:peptide/nickel transport system substrate-binding protein